MRRGVWTKAAKRPRKQVRSAIQRQKRMHRNDDATAEQQLQQRIRGLILPSTRTTLAWYWADKTEGATKQKKATSPGGKNLVVRVRVANFPCIERIISWD